MEPTDLAQRTTLKKTSRGVHSELGDEAVTATKGVSLTRFLNEGMELSEIQNRSDSRSDCGTVQCSQLTSDRGLTDSVKLGIL
jgi:hypothetical protein